MRIAVTGASGFIGRALTQSLRSDGHEVVPIGRSQRQGGVRWDPATHDVDVEAIGPLDAVVHLAGESIGGVWTASKRRAILESRVDGTRTAGKIVEQLEVPVLVSGSAIGFYGDRGDEVLTEASEAGEGFLAEVVSAWEAEANSIAASGDVRVALLRTGIVLDDSGGTLPPLLRVFKLGAGAKLGSGDQWWSWISLVDEVRAIEAILSDERLSGPINLTAPHPITNAHMTRQLADALSRPAFLPAPAFALKALLGDFAQELLLGGQRVMPQVLLDNGFQFEHETFADALDAIL